MRITLYSQIYKTGAPTIHLFPEPSVSNRCLLRSEDTNERAATRKKRILVADAVHRSRAERKKPSLTKGEKEELAVPDSARLHLELQQALHIRKMKQRERRR